MREFFKIAIIFTIAMTFVNGFMFVFALDLFDQDQADTLTDLKVTQEDVNNLTTIQDPVAKSENPFSGIISFVGGVVSNLTGAIGGAGTILAILFKIGTAWEAGIAVAFSAIPKLYCDATCLSEGNDLGLLQVTIIPLVNLVQVISITYLLVYIISALRGGTTG